MELWPAIDLRGGKCVRLLQGDYERETVFGDDPVALIQRFVSEGAEQVHVVDLDGAKEGSPVQLKTIEDMVRSCAVPIQIGGGIRSLDTVRAYIDVGVQRLVVGSVAIEQPELFESMFKTFPEKIVLGLDARDGCVATRGWIETSHLTSVEVAQKYAQAPLAAIVYTDIAKDGMMEGPNLISLREIVMAISLPIIASGGIAREADIEAVVESGAAGCIVGRALYEGAFTIAQARKAAREC